MADDRTPSPLPPTAAAAAADDGAGEPLPAEAAAALAAWTTAEVPDGFADRVVAATHPAGAVRLPIRRRRIAAIAGIASAAAVAVASVVALRSGGSGPTGAAVGARVVQQRETIALGVHGSRGVAVAEAGAEIAWTIAPDGAAELHQTRGDVFYRVEKGGPFVVETPYGQIAVRGTCFRVEVIDMSISKQAWIGGALGAALAATVVVAVYEGGVRVVNARGRINAGPGDRIVLQPGAAPTRLPPGAAGPSVAAIEPPPADSASVAELRQRDQSHRSEIALLRARVRALETTAPAAAEPAREHREGKILDLSHDELVALAKNCEVRFDLPPYGIDPRPLDHHTAETQNLSDNESAFYERTVRAESERYMIALRALYRELTGSDGYESLDAEALAMEIRQKSPLSDFIEARKRIAEERAGIVAPRTSAAGQSVIERLLRLQTTAGEGLERKLAGELGLDKAHELRAAAWAGGSTYSMSGCQD